MKLPYLAAGLLFSTFILPPSFGQGSLTPPGPPAPTMKALDQIASTGIAINDVNTPGNADSEFNINQPGSYYLTGNLNVGKTNGIHIATAGVTVDLNGFQILRTSGSGGDGILINVAAQRCTLKNGSISGFSNGIECGSGGGGLTRTGALFNIEAHNCTTIGLQAGDAWVVENCRAHDNTGAGISSGVGCTLSNCTVANNTGLNGVGIVAGSGSVLNNCTASGNQGPQGILTGTDCSLTHCVAISNGGTLSSSSGISAGSGSTLVDCIANDNTSVAVNLTTNTGKGISVGSNCIVKNCTTDANSADGIRASDGCLIIGNNSNGNGVGSGDGAGVHVTGANNRIEGNNVISNDRGIDITGVGNLIIKNSASNNGATNNFNYVISGSNRYGPIIDITAAGAAGASGNSAASTVASTDPWANFAY